MPQSIPPSAPGGEGHDADGTTMAPTIEIERLEIDRSGDPYGFEGQCSVILERREIIDEDVNPRNKADSAGDILIRFLDDGMYNKVVIDDPAGDSLQSLDYAISNLTTVRDRLALIGGQRVGRCLAQGNFGRCESPRHAGDVHAFPTEGRR